MADHPDDFFGDDDLDNLPANTLNELEQKAFLSTQYESDGRAHGAGVLNGDVHMHNGGPQGTNAYSPAYGFDNGDDVIDLDAHQSSYAAIPAATAGPAPPDEATQREVWRQQRYGGGIGPNWQSRAGLREPASPHAQRTPPVTSKQTAFDKRQPEVSALQAKIEELHRQAQALQKAVEEAKSTALSKSGEIAIVRANQKKEAIEFERRLKAVQQQHAEEAARARADLLTARKDKDRFETNSRFLEHDLAREADRAKSLKRTLKDGHGNAIRGKLQASPLSTPKKDKTMPLRDGFEDNEVVMVSPSKVKDRSKPQSTPKAGSKRKRSQQDEPVGASPSLSFAGHDPPQEDEPMTTPQKSFEYASIQHVEASDAKLEFMQSVLNHRPDRDRERSIEALAKFSLPSNTTVTFASALYDQLNASGARRELEVFQRDVCDVLVHQWAACLEEAFYDPLYDLTELLQHILIISPASVSTALISRLVPLCQKTADLIAVPIVKAFKDSTTNPIPPKSLRRQIDTMHHLELLHLVAVNSIPTSVKAGSSSSPDLVNFWSHVAFDFILVILHGAQPLAQISLVLDLLHTSILPNSFGSIFPDAARQARMESGVVERLSELLLEVPEQLKPPPKPKLPTDFLRRKRKDNVEVDQDPPPYSPSEVLSLRSVVLRLLLALATSDHGGSLLATHRHAIPRLVRFLHESLVNMYATYDGLSGADEPSTDSEEMKDSLDNPTITDGEPAPLNAQLNIHETHAQQINAATTILYILASNYGSLATPSSSPTTAGAPTTILDRSLNIPALLAPIPSALQRYQVALSRIAFSEPWGMEAAIDPDVAEMAHELLDEAVSPEEGAGVLGVFGSGRTTA